MVAEPVRCDRAVGLVPADLRERPLVAVRRVVRCRLGVAGAVAVGVDALDTGVAGEGVHIGLDRVGRHRHEEHAEHRDRRLERGAVERDEIGLLSCGQTRNGCQEERGGGRG